MITEEVIRTVEADSNGIKGSRGGRRSWAGSDGIDTAVEICGKVAEGSGW
jgi:hypothetical protein